MDKAKPATPPEATQAHGVKTTSGAGPVAVPTDLTGKTLGDFRILRRLGQGGMGQVFLAEQVSLKRKVALKLLKPELAANHVSLQRFKQEAEAVARATHANIVQIYAIDERDGHNFMALEYVEGKNLREFLEKKGPPELLLGLRIMAQVGSALQRASELGIVHRDVKPENILLTRKGEVKVADFGLSRCFAEAGPAPNLTQSGVTMGTPLYMSPEQVEGKPVDHRTDVYSFGVTCYHLFAGHPPFRGATPLEVAYQHVHKEPQPLAEIRPDLPPELCAIVQRMMAKDPAGRFQTGREIVREVSRLRDALVAVGASGAPLTTLSSSSAQILPPPPASRSNWRRRVLATVAVLAALAGGLAVGWSHAHRVELRPAPSVEAARPTSAPRERERELQRLVQEALKPESGLELFAGVKHSIDLGLLYLKERRLDEAEQFFKGMAQPGRKAPAYDLLGRIGRAAVLAFRDEPEKSNEQFQTIAQEMEAYEKLVGPGAKVGAIRKEAAAQRVDKLDAYRFVWKDPHLRELIARALTHNRQNAPAHFPVRLERYRHPPPANVRPAPAAS